MSMPVPTWRLVVTAGVVVVQMGVVGGTVVIPIGIPDTAATIA